ncbi:hypothetical protein RB195_022959 [Necator americanus]|uniref:Uncharacterized protein n=1 Tax=Necator americanus TaxID=51031 RepID=A0ABR1EHJ5_NECAM
MRLKKCIPGARDAAKWAGKVAWARRQRDLPQEEQPSYRSDYDGVKRCSMLLSTLISLLDRQRDIILLPLGRSVPVGRCA